VSAEPNGPCYAWLDEDGDLVIIGDQVFPGAPPIAARTMVVVQARAEAEAIRDRLLAGQAPEVDIEGPSAYAADADPTCARPDLLDV
jgi:hypothetical protein